MMPIAVIGAGNSGFAMSGHLLSAGEVVHLWNRTDSNLDPIRRSTGIRVEGVFRGNFRPQMLTNQMKEALEGVELILVTVPANAHADIMRVMAPHLLGGQTVVLNPGRTGGALESRQVLRQYGCIADVTLAEAQTIIYTCRKTAEDACVVLALKAEVHLAAQDVARTEQVLRVLPACLRPHFVAAPSILETSLGNVGMILHCAPVLFNIGWIETPHVQFKHYYEGITPSVADFLTRLDQERLAVAEQCGAAVPSVHDWLRQSYGISGATLYECIQANPSYTTIDAPETLQHRYIYEDVTTGLVPVEAIGHAFGLSMRLTGLVIDLANAILHEDFRLRGRNLQTMGLDGLAGNALIEALRGRRLGYVKETNENW